MIQGLTGSYDVFILMFKLYFFFFLLHLGMSLGLVLSTVCTSESTALMGAVASFYPTIILSGKYGS